MLAADTHAAAVTQFHRSASLHCCAVAQHRATLARRQHRRPPDHREGEAQAPLNTKNLIAVAISIGEGSRQPTARGRCVQCLSDSSCGRQTKTKVLRGRQRQGRESDRRHGSGTLNRAGLVVWWTGVSSSHERAHILWWASLESRLGRLVKIIQVIKNQERVPPQKKKKKNQESSLSQRGGAYARGQCQCCK